MALKDMIRTKSHKKDGDSDSLRKHIIDNIDEYRKLIAY